MNLHWYVERQHELNSVLEYQPTEEQLIAAIIAELGEVSNAAKYGAQGWVWWPRPDAKGFSRKELLGELIDVLHFLLVGYNEKNRGAIQYHEAMIREYAASNIKANDAMFDLPYEILKNARLNRYHLAILSWYALARSYLFTDSELEDAFLLSIEKNLSRWVT